MAYLEQDIHNQNIEHILQRIYNTVKHSLQFWNSLDGLQWSQHSQHSKRFYGAKILAGWTSTETKIFWTNLIIKRYGTGKVQGFVISFPILCLVNIKWNLMHWGWVIIFLFYFFHWFHDFWTTFPFQKDPLSHSVCMVLRNSDCINFYHNSKLV